jgi:hypothetical protein
VLLGFHCATCKIKDYLLIIPAMAIDQKTVNSVAAGSESGVAAPRPGDERYDAQRVESKWFER